MPEVLSLPGSLDLRSASALRSELIARRGRPLQLDAGQVERLGGLGLQVLLSARKTWMADGQSFVLGRASEAFQQQWLAFGAASLPLPGDPA